MSWTQTATNMISLVVGGGGAAALVTAVMQRRAIRADVMAKVNQVTLEWAQRVQADAERDQAEARAEVATARREAAEVRREMSVEMDGLRRDLRAVRDEAEGLAAMLHRLRVVIWAPDMPDVALVRLRQMMPAPGSSNGGSP